MKFRIFSFKKQKKIVVLSESKETQTVDFIIKKLHSNRHAQTENFVNTASVQTDSVQFDCKCQTISAVESHTNALSSPELEKLPERDSKDLSDILDNVPVTEFKRSSLALDPISDSSEDEESESDKNERKPPKRHLDRVEIRSVFDHCENLIKTPTFDDEDDKPLLSDSRMSPMSSTRNSDVFKQYASHSPVHSPIQNSFPSQSPVQQLRTSALNRSNSTSSAKQPKLINQINQKQRESQMQRTSSVRETQKKYKESINRSSGHSLNRSSHSNMRVKDSQRPLSYLSAEKNSFIQSWAQDSSGFS